jgi:hypothetical protein
LDWTEPEARRRVATLRASGWTANQLASMFGVSTEEIDRLSGHFIPEKDCASVG